ncbi:MAG: hypothetical protein GX868_15360 [Actinobacteria bacterium]|nr:hypothetical protein [Actinomycetota bacterium]
MSFARHRRSGSVADLHQDSFIVAERAVHVLEPTARGVALGSAQRDDVVDPAALARTGRDVTRRHSGGGLVAINPGEMLWVDVTIPATDRLWNDDVGVAFLWLGECWREALLAAGEQPTSGGYVVHDGSPVERELGRLICFAGAGAGEVMDGSAKVVGLSQRRTREWARFQCLVHGAFDATESVELVSDTALSGLSGDVRSRDEFAEHLTGAVATVQRPGIVLDRFLDLLDER